MKKGDISQCVVALTHECNLRCSFCYAKTTGYPREHTIEFNDLKRIVDFCKAAAIKYIVFSGGEPTMYPKILDIIDYIREKGNDLLIALTTNGIYLANSMYCQELLRRGIDYIDMSLKGKNVLTPFEANEEKCFDQQIEAIKNLSKMKANFTCSMVLCQNNINTFLKYIKQAYDAGAREFSFTFALDNDESNKKGISYLKSNNPLTLIKNFVSQIENINQITHGEWWVEYTFPLCFYSNEQRKLLQGRLAGPCQIHKRNTISFDPALNLLPCSMYVDTRIGQFGKDFKDFSGFEHWTQTEPYNEVMNTLDRFPSDKCQTCDVVEKCYGGCPIIWKNFSFDDLEKFKTECKLM